MMGTLAVKRLIMIPPVFRSKIKNISLCGFIFADGEILTISRGLIFTEPDM